MNPLSRREFLERGAGMAALAALPDALSLLMEAATGAPNPATALLKGISLGGPAPLVERGHPNDYRLWGNREYIREASGTAWVKLWVSWHDLQHGFQPDSKRESWDHLNTMAPLGAVRPALRELDAQIAAVNRDSFTRRLRGGGGIAVMLSVYQAYPPWASAAIAGDPARWKRPREAKLPLDLSPDGPWGWFVEHLLARYRKGVPRNGAGPTAGGPPGARSGFGNPEGAVIEAFELCNEPNYTLWPQAGAAERTAEMIRSAAVLAERTGGPRLLAPATADAPDPGTGQDPVARTDWRSFTEEVLSRLTEAPPAVPVEWSHHNYADVEDGRSPSRVEEVIGLLDRAGWWSERARRLWLTEGGYVLKDPLDQGERAAQAGLIRASFARMQSLPEVTLWTQHSVNDVAGNPFKSALRDDFDRVAGVPGPPRPAWYAWAELPNAARRGAG